MNKPAIFFVLSLSLAFAASAVAGNDEESQACSEKGEAVRVSCIESRCSSFAPGSTAQLKCEESIQDSCEAKGRAVENRCLGK